MDRVIPPFYACYLLRSTVRHQNLYVGSTPNPVRRLKQHNGLAKGGAVRTSRDSLRPWEMTCLVTGFPSKIAALQFEWAWQNTHLTRHIAVEDRITQTQQRTSSKTGRTRKRPGRPRVSLTDKLANLHILLRAKSFERWPLEVKFFAPDVFKYWERWISKTSEKVRPGIKIALELNEPVHGPGENVQQNVGISALDVTFQPMKSLIEKSRILLTNPGNECAVCKKKAEPTSSLLLVCSKDECKSVFHMACLSNHFLSTELDRAAIVPTQGHCPTCKTALRWEALVKVLSVRMRGEKEIVELFKERRNGKKVGALQAIEPDACAYDTAAEESENDTDHLAPAMPLVSQEAGATQSSRDSVDWHDVDDIPPHPLEASSQGRKRDSTNVGVSHKPHNRKEEIVIEDSDWDEAEIVA
ncbi:hypothetical protein AAFC00_006296 [Neodothiora populina]|uniref:Structure-specific endonuclease subunit SLX1 n=1 Tax=Neodothiora populina TaxID=2781224 RepID=A0ABR3P630_9PEZI